MNSNGLVIIFYMIFLKIGIQLWQQATEDNRFSCRLQAQLAIMGIMGLLMLPTPALASFTMPVAGGIFTKMGTWFQDLVNFFHGPLAHGFLIIIIVLGVILWNISPREGIMGSLVRIAISGFILVNIAAWMSSFQEDSNSFTIDAITATGGGDGGE